MRGGLLQVVQLRVDLVELADRITAVVPDALGLQHQSQQQADLAGHGDRQADVPQCVPGDRRTTSPAASAPPAKATSRQRSEKRGRLAAPGIASAVRTLEHRAWATSMRRLGRRGFRDAVRLAARRLPALAGSLGGRGCRWFLRRADLGLKTAHVLFDFPIVEAWIAGQRRSDPPGRVRRAADSASDGRRAGSATRCARQDVAALRAADASACPRS